jgi:uncharacterized protein
MVNDSSTPSSPTSDLTEPSQHSLPFSILLHLLPGAALTVFIVLAAPTVTSLGFPVIFALFAGIGLVIVPIELGILLIHSWRETGSFRLGSTVIYREKLPSRQLIGWSAGLAVWFLVFVAVSMVFLDEWLAETFFWWMPEEILQFSATEDVDEPLATPILIVLLLVAFVFNGFVGPIVEELYFRGYLLPRIERYGRWAPLINATLFSLYHFWTPWQNLARIIGFLPIAWAAWRFKSIQVTILAHVTINLLFLFGLVALFLEASL